MGKRDKRGRRGPSIAKLVAKRQEKVDALCRKYHVRELDLFGSAATGEFRPRRSDIDFMVRFEASSPAEHAQRYFGLLEDLQDLFHRRIDLIEPGAVDNPYFLESAEKSRVRIYAA